MEYEKQFGFLKNALSKDLLHHSYIFYGTNGAPMMDFAFALATYIQCLENNSGVACGKCQHCRMSANGLPIDTYIVDPEAGESIKIEDSREAQKFLELSRSLGNKKILIFNDFERATPEARELLLKTLEEPSCDSLIILITNEKKSLPATIMSRCHSLYFSRPDGFLVEKGDDPLVDGRDLVISQCQTIVSDSLFDKMILSKEVGESEEAKKQIYRWMEVFYISLMAELDHERFSGQRYSYIEPLRKKANSTIIVKALGNLLSLVDRMDTANTPKRLLIEDALLNC